MQQRHLAMLLTITVIGLYGCSSSPPSEAGVHADPVGGFGGAPGQGGTDHSGAGGHGGAAGGVAGASPAIGGGGIGGSGGSGPFQCGALLVDSRDGRTYETMPFGNACWMAQNINVGTYVSSTEHPSGDPHSNLADNGIIEKYCMFNDEAQCDALGGMYDWDETMQYAKDEGAQGICPTGWHVPTDADFHAMLHLIDSSVPATHDPNFDPTTHAANGEDWGELLKQGGATGFDWLITGRRAINGVFLDYEIGFLWTSTLAHNWAPWLFEVFPDRTDGTHPFHHKFRTSSVRCVLDTSTP